VRAGLEKSARAVKVPGMKRARLLCLLPCLLACPAACFAGTAPQTAAVEIARSSLLTLSGTTEPAALQLWVRRTAEPAPLTVTEFATAIDGKAVTATRTAAGGWSVPLGALGGGEHRLSVTVGHDGVRELLEGRFTPAAAPAGAPGIAGLGGTHKQLLWWALNIGIVLIAAIAISRRMS
jgi:hypothetical protein